MNKSLVTIYIRVNTLRLLFLFKFSTGSIFSADCLIIKRVCSKLEKETKEHYNYDAIAAFQSQVLKMLYLNPGVIEILKNKTKSRIL